MAAALQRGTGRKDFLEDLEAEMENKDAAFQAARCDPDAARHSLLFTEVVHLVAHRHFFKETKQPQWYVDAATYRRELLAERQRRRAATPCDNVASPPPGLFGAAPFSAATLARLAAEIVAVSARLGKHRRSCRRRRLRETTNQLRIAWASRSMSDTHALSRQLAGGKLGAKKRSYRALPSAQPSPEQWRAFLARRAIKAALLLKMTFFHLACVQSLIS